LNQGVIKKRSDVKTKHKANSFHFKHSRTSRATLLIINPPHHTLPYKQSWIK